MFSRTLTNVGAGVALAAALALGTGAAAYAHECYNPSRSDQGDAKAGANSQAWFTLVVADAIQGDADSGFITQEQADCVKTAYAATDAPDTDWDLLAEVIETSYRQVANRRQLAALDALRPDHAGG